MTLAQAHTHSVITKPPIQTRRQSKQKIFRFINIIHLFIYHFTCHHFCYHLFALHARESNLCHQTIKCGIYCGKKTCQTFFGLILWLFGSFCFNGRLFAYSIGYGLWKLLCQSDYTN